MKTVRVNFGTTRPGLVYRYENNDWQPSNVFVVNEGLGTYTFQARDSFGCIAEITLSESDLEFPPGSGVIIISKELTGGTAPDDDIYFKFNVSGPVSFSNVLVSVNDPATLEGLPPGEYVITEADPPTGYINTSTSKTINLLDGQLAGRAFENEKDNVNPVPTGSGEITINKVVTNEESTDMDVVFTANLIGPIIKYGIEFSVNTPAVISDLPNGTYTIEEIGLPDGYFLNTITPPVIIINNDTLAHSVNVINTAGAENVGPGQITFEKQVYEDDGTGTLVRINLEDDTLFQADLFGPLSIEDLQFSVNNKLVINNLPLGEYTPTPDNNVAGFVNFQINPSTVTVTESSDTFTFSFFNEKGQTPTDFATDEIYVLGTEPGQSQSNTTWRIAKMRINLSTGTGTMLNHVDFRDLGIEMGISSNNDMYLSQSQGGYLCANMEKSNAFAVGELDLHIFNPDLSLRASETLTSWGPQTTNSARTCFWDSDDNLYVILSRDQILRINKYDVDLNLLWSTSYSTPSDYSIYPIPRTWGMTFFKDHLIVLFNRRDNGVDFWELARFKKSDGTFVNKNASIPSSHTPDIPVIERFNETQFIIGISDDYINEGDMFVYNQDLSLFRTCDLASMSTQEIVLSGAQSERPWTALPNQLVVIGNNNNSRMVCFDPLTDTLEWEIGVSSPNREPQLLENNLVIISSVSSPVDGVTIVNHETGTNQASNNNAFDNTDLTKDEYPFATPEDDWQGSLYDGTPPPPTGTNTVIINKTIQNGLPADDDKGFNISIIGPSTRVGLTVSVNSPLTVDDLPDGTYTVQETGTGPEFSLQSITPQTFTLDEDNPSQTVEIVNDKLSEEFASGTLEITDVATSTETAEPADIDIKITKAPTKSGSIEIRDADVPSSLVLVNFDAGDSVQDIAGRLVEASNNITTDPKVIDADMTTPVTGTTAGAGDVVRITADLPGVVGNSISFIVTFSSDIEIDFQSGGQFTKAMTGGKDGPTRTIYLEYPWRGAVGLSPNIQFDFSDTDDEEDVAQLIVDRVNLSTMELTATRTGAIVTLTEDRAGPTYAGETFKVILYTSLVGLNPSNGEVVLSIT